MVVQSRKAHRFSVALVVAFALSLVPGAAAQVIIKNPCANLTPSDPAYWMYSCWAYDAIAAFLAGPVAPFLVR
jgi:hypothetical protein